MGAVAFFDIAPTLTGYCVGDGDGPPVADAWEFPDFGDDLGALAFHLVEWLRAIVLRYDVDRVAYESPIHKPHDKLWKLRRIYGLGVVLEYACMVIGNERGRPLPCGETDLRLIKSLTTGDQWADKKLVAAAVAEAGIPLPKTIAEGRHDAADAAGGWVILLSEHDAAAASPWIARFRGTLL